MNQKNTATLLEWTLNLHCPSKKVSLEGKWKSEENKKRKLTKNDIIRKIGSQCFPYLKTHH